MNNCQIEYHKFPYKWTLKDTTFIKDKGTVFSCFSCGGGSTMGYKLAGFDVIGCNEIDKKMMDCYILNHYPKHAYLEDIRTFKNRSDLPDELFNLDILDGSPPCSSFSMAGNRESDWGKEKKFREGQSEQVLDTLFFDFIELAKKLKPKVVIAENVKGLLIGEAQSYVRKIYKDFDEAGYYCQHWLLDASRMGVPQKRERVFFVCLRKDLADPFLDYIDMFTKAPILNLDFREKRILFHKVFKDYTDRPLQGELKVLWDARKDGDVDFCDSNSRLHDKPNNGFNYKYIYNHKVANTITGNDNCILFEYPRFRNFDELCECGSFPKDYNFNGNKSEYLIGMSVPPVMMAQVVTEVYSQWLSKIDNNQVHKVA